MVGSFYYSKKYLISSIMFYVYNNQFKQKWIIYTIPVLELLNPFLYNFDKFQNYLRGLVKRDILHSAVPFSEAQGCKYT